MPAAITATGNAVACKEVTRPVMTLVAWPVWDAVTMSGHLPCLAGMLCLLHAVDPPLQRVRRHRQAVRQDGDVEAPDRTPETVATRLATQVADRFHLLSSPRCGGRSATGV
jgi:hypothetical protein